MISGEFNYGYNRRSTNHHSSNFVYDDEVNSDDRGQDNSNPASTEDHILTGYKPIQDDILSRDKQLLLPDGVIEEIKGENEHSDDDLGGYLGRRKTLVKQK